FDHVDGAPRGGVARLLADGTLDPAFAVTTDGEVHALALGAEALYVGGSFLEVGGEVRYGLGSVDPATGATTAWVPDDFQGATFALAFADGRLFVGGNFDVDFEYHLVAYDDATGDRLTAWEPSPNNPVTALAVGDGAVFPVGRFVIGGEWYLARVDAAT